MAKFLNTSGTTYHLEELIKNSTDRLILISPYLKLNERIKELLEDKNRLKIDIRIVYGKTDLQPNEADWLKKLEFVRTSFCKNLHAKCYLSENACIITSLNLYDFSQVNNNEMGIYIDRIEDADLYRDTYEEAQRIIRISDEVKISFDSVKEPDSLESENNNVVDDEDLNEGNLLTTSRLAKKYKLKTAEVTQILIKKGLIEDREGKSYLSDEGMSIGGQYRPNRFGGYFLWPENILD